MTYEHSITAIWNQLGVDFAEGGVPRTKTLGVSSIVRPTFMCLCDCAITMSTLCNKKNSFSKTMKISLNTGTIGCAINYMCINSVKENEAKLSFLSAFQT